MKPAVVGAVLLFAFGCTNTEPLQPNEARRPGIAVPVDVIPTRDNVIEADPVRGPRGYSIPGSRHNPGGASPGLGSGTGSSGSGGFLREE